MKLSDGEKLIAFMLADIMEASEIKGNIDPSLVKTAIAGDDLWALRWEYSSLFHSDGPSDEIVDETAKIMTMCRVVENSIAQLNNEEQATIAEWDHEVFIGFDGNEEPHYGVAVMLVENLGRYAEWKDRPLNSHCNTLARYRRMKRVFDESPKRNHGLLDLAGINALMAD